MDANFNRAREALRVLEDWARFIVNDARLSGRAKQLRHDLSECLSAIPAGELLAARDTDGDVGTTITTAAEQVRGDAGAVLHAAGRRLSEALRCLEEYSKIEAAQIAGRIESLRYRAYQLEKEITARADVTGRFGQVRLYVLLTEELCRRPILEVAGQVLAGGAQCVQLREKAKSDGQLLTLARQVCVLCHDGGALFIMNDRPDLAVLADADGVHLGQDDLPVAQVRSLIRPGMIVGKSTHSLDEAKDALDEGADYIAVGSIFASATKPEVATSGTALLAAVRRLGERPIIAIGGITAENAAEAMAVGADGVAVCQAVIGADDPAAAAGRIAEQFTKPD